MSAGHGRIGASSLLASAVALLAVVGLTFPTTASSAPPAPAPAVAPASAPSQREALVRLARLMRDPRFARWVQTLAFPPDYSRPCPYEALIRATFPDWSAAVGIAHRESRCQPGAANPRSSARGLFQLLQSLHAWRYGATGACTPAEWAVPWCNVRAARGLYDAAGASPWRLG